MSKKRTVKRRGRIIPFVVALLIFLIALLLYTFLTSNPKDLKLGVLSLDEGVATSQGGSNLGEQMAERLTSGDIFNSAGGGTDTHLNSYSLEFKTYETQEELNRALESDEVTGAIVIPEDYTRQKINETTSGITSGITDTANAAVEVVVQNTSDPAVQQQIGGSITRLLNSTGIDSYSAFDAGSSMIDDARDPDPRIHVWLLLPPIFAALLLAHFYPIRRGPTFQKRLVRLGVTALMSALASIAISIADYVMLTYVYLYSNDVMASLAELWIMNFLVMLFFGGLAQVRIWLGALVAALLILLGAIISWLGFIDVPFLVLPWIVETFTDISLGETASDLPGITLWNSGLRALWAYALAGIILGIVAAALPHRHTNNPRENRASRA